MSRSLDLHAGLVIRVCSEFDPWHRSRPIMKFTLDRFIVSQNVSVAGDGGYI